MKRSSCVMAIRVVTAARACCKAARTSSRKTHQRALRTGVEVFHALKKVFGKRKLSTSVGDEGGFAPDLRDDEEALKVIVEAIEAAGYAPGKQVAIALDPAASELFDDGVYRFKKSG